MRHRIFFTFLLCILLFAANALAAEDVPRSTPPDATVTPQVSQGGPSALLVSERFEFEPVFDGAEVVHAFVLQNKGTEPLKIEKVRTG
ncbi:MAG: hypothetical protein B6245_10370 [Desulfobacteraceae bacterium 4572_88]|nr:MAG: hypothetical protein B6245_10370 [Desulfobacteraceae bacterium 4572_88]RLC19532.1 MAG: hypothetical protein DRI57_06995 [Deltaproteobacteria bacterium]